MEQSHSSPSLAHPSSPAPQTSPQLSPGGGLRLRTINTNDRIVKLNIGGHKYITTRETLTKGGENFFSSLLSGKFSALIDDKGYYFIDRDGSYFAPILEFLRTGEFFVTGMREEAVAREALFYSIQLPINATMKLKHNRLHAVSLQHDGFYLPNAIFEQRGVISNASVLFFRDDGSGYFSDAKEFAYEITSTAKLMVLVTITCNNLPYNFLFLNGCLSDGSSEFSFFKPEEVHTASYYYGYISIPETDVSAILFGEDHVFLRFSKRVLVRVGPGEKYSLNAGLFPLTKSDSFLGFETNQVSITICKAASADQLESVLQILSFGEFILVRDLKSSSCSFYVFHLAKGPKTVNLYH